MSRIPIDLKSLLLYLSYWIIRLTVNFAAFDLKIIVELLGSLAGASTVFYNGVRIANEIKTFLTKRKDNKKQWPKVKKD